jgi:signal transduction histidine kinase
MRVTATAYSLALVTPRPDPACRSALAAPPPPAARPVPRQLLVHGLQVAVANTAIAGLVASLNGGRFLGTLAYSQCIGLSIWLCIDLGRFLFAGGVHGWPAGWRSIVLVGVGGLLGYVVGTTLCDVLLGHSTWPTYVREPRALLRDLGPTLVFCVFISGWFYTRGQARAQRTKAAAAAHEATLARLTLLQSQLEPHMLFNTLANLRAQIAADPPRAQEMLDHLIAFLRATLDASRQPEHPLADEFARIADYLALMQVRMGERLDASLDLPAALADIGVPPLLLQPLVENAIKHGLEPQRGAGTLHVSATLDGATLVLRVADTGRGLAAAAAAREREPVAPSAGGFGTSQVRERLHALHGGAARFTLTERGAGGTLAEIRLPLTTRPPATP